MKVIDVICRTMRLVGRSDAADQIESAALQNGALQHKVYGADGEQTAVETHVLSDEVKRLKRAFLTYLNAVLDELARGYFPLDTEEEMSSESGAYAFADFLKAPLKINRVTEAQNPVEWHISPNYLHTKAKNITVFYEYVPPALGEDDEFFYPVFAVSARLVEYGMAAEYFLVAGDGTGYSAWESKYRNEIENLLSRSSVKDRIPPRRWI
ncbi:MAG: hypothetical protein K2H78_01425 [Clostridia bacterium]|nr:hypothetical protein [Clostridia bacterium]